jgi:hypothetical protein
MPSSAKPSQYFATGALAGALFAAGLLAGWRLATVADEAAVRATASCGGHEGERLAVCRWLEGEGLHCICAPVESTPAAVRAPGMSL